MLYRSGKSSSQNLPTVCRRPYCSPKSARNEYAGETVILPRHPDVFRQAVVEIAVMGGGRAVVNLVESRLAQQQHVQCAGPEDMAAEQLQVAESSARSGETFIVAAHRAPGLPGHGEGIGFVLQQGIAPVMVCAGPDADGVESIRILLPRHGVEQGVFRCLVVPFPHGLHLRLGPEVAAAGECEGARMVCQYVDGPAHQMGARNASTVHADHQAVPGGLVPGRVVDGAGRRHVGVLGLYPDEPDGTRRSVEDVSRIQRFRGAVVDDDDLVIDILDGSLQRRKEGPQGTRHFPAASRRRRP